MNISQSQMLLAQGKQCHISIASVDRYYNMLNKHNNEQTIIITRVQQTMYMRATTSQLMQTQ